MVQIAAAVEFVACFCAFWDLLVYFFIFIGGGGGGGGEERKVEEELETSGLPLDLQLMKEYILGTSSSQYSEY